MTRVAMIVIGAEILTGKFPDANGPHAISVLRKWGSDLVRLSVIDDDVSTIAREIALCRQTADFVITTGGIGPTHDDLTYEGVARGMEVDLMLNEEIKQIIVDVGMPLSESTLQMALIPAGSDLVPDQCGAFPVVKVQNVFIFPGVPRLFREKLKLVESWLRGEERWECRATTMMRESVIAPSLREVVARHPEVRFGSYPRPKEEGFSVLFTLEANTKEQLDAAIQSLRIAIELSSIDGVDD